jgi:vacuolar-type H+-ATPase subunit I/STV1
MEKDQDIKTDNDPVTAVSRKEKELARLDLERARDGNDLAETFGRQNIGPAIASKGILENKKKEDEKFERAVRQLLQQMREELERRLEELNTYIAEMNAKIEELREELETTETQLEKQFGKDWQEKLKRGDLDLDEPLLRQWLMQQQQLNEYLLRREKLIKERDELEKQISEIEASNLHDHLKLLRMEDILESGTSAGVHKVWQDERISLALHRKNLAMECLVNLPECRLRRKLVLAKG